MRAILVFLLLLIEYIILSFRIPTTKIYMWRHAEEKFQTGLRVDHKIIPMGTDAIIWKTTGQRKQA